jgi:hypothetical protein
VVIGLNAKRACFSGWAGPTFCLEPRIHPLLGFNGFVVSSSSSSRRVDPPVPCPLAAAASPRLAVSLQLEGLGAAMELFMIHTGFCTLLAPPSLTPLLQPSIQPSPVVISSKFLIHRQASTNGLSYSPVRSPVFGCWYLIGRLIGRLPSAALPLS